VDSKQKAEKESGRFQGRGSVLPEKIALFKPSKEPQLREEGAVAKKKPT